MNILDLKRKLMPLSGYMGGGSPASSSTTSTTGLPEWAKGYAQDTLAKQAALSDRPYEAYGANRIQGFTPMQEQARQNASNMNAGPEGFSQGISAYMSPYQQQVTDIQKREARRQSDINAQGIGAKAAQVGAFGTRRDLLEAENRRNLDQQMGDIQARGSQAAFDQASNQFRQGITQGMDVNRLQSAYGAQEQAMGQQGLNQAYQDYQNQRDYPQQQLSNMSNMIRGLPLGSTTTGTGYQNPGSPSFGQQIGALGTAAYGLKQFFADGGSVDSQQNIENIVSKLSDQQLDQAEEAAKARGDQEQLQAIQMEKAARASMQRGLGAMPVDMDQMLPTEESMARGGIVAFAKGGMDTDEFGYNPNASFSSDTGGYVEPEPEPELDEEGMRKGLLKSLYKQYQTPAPAYVEDTPAQHLAAVMAARKELTDVAGPSQYNEERANIKRMQEENAVNRKHGKGLAALQAASAMLQGNDPLRGLAAGAGAFGKAYGDTSRAVQGEERALQKMRFDLTDAERKEKMGLHRDAAASVASAAQARRAAHAARQEEGYRQRTLQQGILAATKPEKGEAGLKLPEQLAAAEIAAAENPNDPAMQNRVKALRSAVNQTRTSFGTSVSEAGTGKREDTAAALAQAAQLKREAEAAAALKAVSAEATIDPTMRKLQKTDPAGYKAEVKRRVEDRLKSGTEIATSLATPKPGAGTPAPAAPAPTAAPIPLPANPTAASLVNGKVYLTPRGPAKWNATTQKFTPVAP